ncbi:MFS transporter [Plantactinospora siamensis]|uniref:Multidrug efflux pump Tap n=1 Tax=Plantactinospora siamensis TaxID=555372 RepID=A0ABV6NYF7_9ACTN
MRIGSIGAYMMDRRPLAVPAFRRMWLASAVAAVGGSFSTVAVPTQLYARTGSSAAVAVAAVVAFGALAVSSLWSGALADRADRRRVLLAAHAGLGATYLGLWAQSALGVRSVAALLVPVAVQGFALGGVLATTGAVLPRLVPAHLLPAANSLNSLVRYGGSVLGPLLAGALIPLVGLRTLYLFDAVALLAVLTAVWRLPALPPGPAPAGGAPPARPGTVRQVFAGFRYLAANRLLLAVLGVDLAAMVFGMPSALFPELAARTYGGPPGGGMVLGLLYAAYPAGVVAAGLFSGTFTRSRRQGALLIGSAAAWGGTLLLLGLLPWLLTGLVALLLGGAVNAVLSAARNAITQEHTDDALRGRIQGSLTVVLMGGPQLANVLHGVAAARWNAPGAVAAGGVLTVAAVALIGWRVPALRRYGMPKAGPARSAHGPTTAAASAHRPRTAAPSGHGPTAAGHRTGGTAANVDG